MEIKCINKVVYSIYYILFHFILKRQVTIWEKYTSYYRRILIQATAKNEKDLANAFTRDRDHYKVVGLKNLANTKKHSGRCFVISLAFARHFIYHLKVHTCYTIQYSQ